MSQIKHNPLLCTDGYKVGHHKQYHPGTTMVYSNYTCRNTGYMNGVDEVVVFGVKYTFQYIQELWQENFFNMPKDEVCGEAKEYLSKYLMGDYDVSHFEALHDLGYLPIHVKSLPEGTVIKAGIPLFTIRNTVPEFFWITNFLETLISTLIWKPVHSASLARAYRKLLDKEALETDPTNAWLVDHQAHDFALRGMQSLDAGVSSGMGFATSFRGSDTIPIMKAITHFYGDKDMVNSVNATEHSVMCSGSKEDEIGTFRRLMESFPTGILSIVSDTWDLWKVLTEYLPILKDEILARDGKLTIRPDSGDPVDIICGTLYGIEDFTTKCKNLDDLKEWAREDMFEREIYSISLEPGESGPCEVSGLYKWNGKYYHITVDNIEWDRHDKTYYYHSQYSEYKYTIEEVNIKPKHKGVIELLWDVFGGTVNEQGYKVLDPHIGAIYGDSITLDRAEEIIKHLKAKGFASTNIIFGVGSYSMGFATRDSQGGAVKSTAVEINGELVEIFKDPITDDGTKKSAKGLIMVNQDMTGAIFMEDQIDWETEKCGILKDLFIDGKFVRNQSLSEIRDVLKSSK